MSGKLEDLKHLRKQTCAGMVDCQRALQEAAGDLSKAEALLKEWGLASQALRADRPVSQGRVFLDAGPQEGALVEVLCETDFVARNPAFLEAGSRMARLVRDLGPQGADTGLQAAVADLGRIMKENVKLGRIVALKAEEGEGLEAYAHGEGSLAVLLRWRLDTPSGRDKPELRAFVHDLALHVAAFDPRFLEPGAIPADYLARKREDFLLDLEAEAGGRAKDPALREAILEGKLRKHVSQACLLTQGFVRDEKLRVSAALEALNRSLGLDLGIMDFVRLKVAEASD